MWSNCEENENMTNTSNKKNNKETDNMHDETS
jgi:hypothetical protein